MVNKSRKSAIGKSRFDLTSNGITCTNACIYKIADKVPTIASERMYEVPSIRTISGIDEDGKLKVVSYSCNAHYPIVRGCSETVISTGAIGETAEILDDIMKRKRKKKKKGKKGK